MDYANHSIIGINHPKLSVHLMLTNAQLQILPLRIVVHVSVFQNTPILGILVQTNVKVVCNLRVIQQALQIIQQQIQIVHQQQQFNIANIYY